MNLAVAAVFAAVFLAVLGYVLYAIVRRSR